MSGNRTLLNTLENARKYKVHEEKTASGQDYFVTTASNEAYDVDSAITSIKWKLTDKEEIEQ